MFCLILETGQICLLSSRALPVLCTTQWLWTGNQMNFCNHVLQHPFLFYLTSKQSIGKCHGNAMLDEKIRSQNVKSAADAVLLFDHKKEAFAYVHRSPTCPV